MRGNGFSPSDFNRKRALVGNPFRGFSFVEILIAVAVLSTVLLGTYSFIAAGGRQAVRIENVREISSLLLSAKACVRSFWTPYLRSVTVGTKIPLSFGASGNQCLTGASFTGSAFPSDSPEISLGSSFGDGSGPANEGGIRTYDAYFISGSGGLPIGSATANVTVTDGTIIKSLSFEVAEP